MMASCGLDCSTEASIWLGKGIAPVFVFETDADFSTSSKRGRPSLDKNLQNYFVKKVSLYLNCSCVPLGFSFLGKDDTAPVKVVLAAMDCSRRCQIII
jgi:hypothetical protein